MKRFENILFGTIALLLMTVLVGAVTYEAPITYRLYDESDLSVATTSIELARSLDMDVDYVIETDDGFDIIGVKDRHVHILYITDVSELEYNLEQVTSNEARYYLKQMHLNIPNK